MDMKHLPIKHLAKSMLVTIAALCLTACDMMTDDRDDCPYGLYLQFVYDYNLQRADMFNDHCGAVDVYVFDEDGNYVTMQSEQNNGSVSPLADPNYRMHLDLPTGNYQLIVLAGQDAYSDQMARDRAHFVREVPTTGESMTKLNIRLDTQSGDVLVVDNMSAPLDTLWHGMETTPIAVSKEKPTYHKVSLTRDTKQIHVSLRELDDPTLMDIDNYEMRIYDRNSHLLWNNDVDEAEWVVYSPYATWNTEDLSNTTTEGGKIGHADFMTSRIMYHGDAAEDGSLVVTSLETGEEVINVNLPNMLSRLANYSDLQRYSAQEFLDRGYDYSLEFFLKGGELKYADISISILKWSVRVQFENLN